MLRIHRWFNVLPLAGLLALSACSHDASKNNAQVQITDHRKAGSAAGALGAHGPQHPALRLLVLDFSTMDQKILQYLPPPPQEAPLSSQTGMNTQDRSILATGQQGNIREDEIGTALDQAQSNWKQLSDLDRAHYSHLEHAITGTQQGRATVLGADLLANDLSQFSGWTVLDRSRWLHGLHGQVSAQALAQLVGTAHPDILVYGLVEDLGERKSNFTGYGVDTVARRTYLHVLVKAVSAHDFSVLASGEYSAEADESQDERSQAFNSDRVRNLMSQAVQQASNDLIARLGPQASTTAP